MKVEWNVCRRTKCFTYLHIDYRVQQLRLSTGTPKTKGHARCVWNTFLAHRERIVFLKDLRRVLSINRVSTLSAVHGLSGLTVTCLVTIIIKATVKARNSRRPLKHPLFGNGLVRALNVMAYFMCNTLLYILRKFWVCHIEWSNLDTSYYIFSNAFSPPFPGIPLFFRFLCLTLNEMFRHMYDIRYRNPIDDTVVHVSVSYW